MLSSSCWHSSPAIFSRRPQPVRRSSASPTPVLRLRSSEGPRLLARPPRLRRTLRPEKPRRHRPHRLHQDQRPPAHRALQSATARRLRSPKPHRLHRLQRRTDARLPRLTRHSSRREGRQRPHRRSRLRDQRPHGNLVEFVEPQPDGIEAKNAGKFLPSAASPTPSIISAFSSATAQNPSPSTATSSASASSGAAAPRQPCQWMTACPRRPELRRVHALQRSSLPTRRPGTPSLSVPDLAKQLQRSRPPAYRTRDTATLTLLWPRSLRYRGTGAWALHRLRQARPTLLRRLRIYRNGCREFSTAAVSHQNNYSVAAAFLPTSRPSISAST